MHEYVTALNELPTIPACQSLCADDDYDSSWGSFFGSLAALCLEGRCYAFTNAMSYVKKLQDRLHSNNEIY